MQSPRIYALFVRCNMTAQACPACGDCAVSQPHAVCEICLLLRELCRGIESTVLHHIHALETHTQQLSHLVSRLQQQQLHWTQRQLLLARQQQQLTDLQALVTDPDQHRSLTRQQTSLAQKQQQLRSRQNEPESGRISPLHEH